MSNNYVDFQNALAIALASGMGGEGEMMVAKTIMDINITGASGANMKKLVDLPQDYNISNYDIILLKTSRHQLIWFNQNHVPQFDGSFVMTGDDSSHSIVIRLQPSEILYSYSLAYTGEVFIALYGIKFTGTKSIDYTENEQVVGRWKIEGDNKLIYQKTIVTTPVNGRASIPLTLISDNIKMVVNTNIMLVSDDFCYPVPSANDTFGAQTYYEIKKNPTLYYIDMWIGNLLYNRYSKCYITLQYTKTTD